MNEPLHVTRQQVAAAKLRVVLDRKLGRATPELVWRIASVRLRWTPAAELHVATSEPSAKVEMLPEQSAQSEEVADLPAESPELEPQNQAAWHLAKALHLIVLEDYRQGLEHALRAVDLYRSVNVVDGEADALEVSGLAAAHLGNYGAARSDCQAALDIYRQRFNQVGEASDLRALGYIEYRSDRYRESVGYYNQALDLRQSPDNTENLATILDALGRSLVALGQHGAARDAWHEALRLYRAHGRNDDAERLQRELEELDIRDNADHGSKTGE